MVCHIFLCASNLVNVLCFFFAELQVVWLNVAKLPVTSFHGPWSTERGPRVSQIPYLIRNRNTYGSNVSHLAETDGLVNMSSICINKLIE